MYALWYMIFTTGGASTGSYHFFPKMLVFLGSHFFYNLTIVFINNYVWLIWLVMILFFCFIYNSDNSLLNKIEQYRIENIILLNPLYNIFF